MAKTALLPLLVVGGLTACTGGDGPAGSTTSTTSTTVTTVVAPVESQADGYFEALATNDPGNLATASAIPDTEAALYAEHQVSARRLLGVTATRTVAAGGEGFAICDVDGACTDYGAVVTDPATGLVTGFSIDGVPLTGRIVGGGQITERDGVVARVASAYRSNGGDVLVVVEVDNATGVSLELFGFAAVLEPGTTGAGIETVGSWGASTVAAGSTTEVLLRFPSAEISGRLRLSGLRGDGHDIDLDVRVPTPGAANPEVPTPGVPIP